MMVIDDGDDDDDDDEMVPKAEMAENGTMSELPMQLPPPCLSAVDFELTWPHRAAFFTVVSGAAVVIGVYLHHVFGNDTSVCSAIPNNPRG